MDRKEHIAWCKQRAKEYIQRGDLDNAWTSFLTDMSAHEETRGHSALELGLMLMMSGHLNTPTKMQEFIDGFE